MKLFRELLDEELSSQQRDEVRAEASGVAQGAAPVSTEDRYRAMIATETALTAERASWETTLGLTFPCTHEDVRRTFKRRALDTHPDRPGGSHEAFLAVRAARDEAFAALDHVDALGRRHKVAGYAAWLK